MASSEAPLEKNYSQSVLLMKQQSALPATVAFKPNGQITFTDTHLGQTIMSFSPLSGELGFIYSKVEEHRWSARLLSPSGDHGFFAKDLESGMVSFSPRSIIMFGVSASDGQMREKCLDHVARLLNEFPSLGLVKKIFDANDIPQCSDMAVVLTRSSKYESDDEYLESFQKWTDLSSRSTFSRQQRLALERKEISPNPSHKRSSDYLPTLPPNFYNLDAAHDMTSYLAERISSQECANTRKRAYYSSSTGTDARSKKTRRSQSLEESSSNDSIENHVNQPPVDKEAKILIRHIMNRVYGTSKDVDFNEIDNSDDADKMALKYVLND